MTIIDDLKRFKESSEVIPEAFAQYLITKLKLNPGLFETGSSDDKPAPRQRKPRAKKAAEEKDDTLALFEGEKKT